MLTGGAAMWPLVTAPASLPQASACPAPNQREARAALQAAKWARACPRAEYANRRRAGRALETLLTGRRLLQAHG